MKRLFPALSALALCQACATDRAEQPPSAAPPPPATATVQQAGAQQAPPTQGDKATAAESEGAAGETSDAEGKDLQRLEVAIANKSGSVLLGKVELTKVDDGVKVVVRVADAEPGLHAVHIHENPDCSAPDASSAGGHYNPDGHPHGLPPKTPRHFGDLGNMGTKMPDGKGLLEFVVQGANLNAEGKYSLLNRSLVIHANEDTGAQPAGNAGGRIGCAELTVAAASGEGMGKAVPQ